MAKRFTATEIWDEDWFLEMPMEYRLFWFFMLSTCDHAGLFKVNLGSFCRLNEVKITVDNVLIYFNAGKERLRVVNQSVWLIEDFFVYQYGTTFNPNNRVHESIESCYNKLGIKMTSIRGLKDLKDRVKDKDKDKDKDKYNKDGKIKKRETAILFSDDKTHAIFSNDSTQKLGENQFALLKEGNLKPKDVYFGLIN